MDLDGADVTVKKGLESALMVCFGKLGLDDWDQRVDGLRSSKLCFLAGYGPEVCNTTTFTTLTATPTPTAVVLPDLAINTSTNARCGSEFGRCPNNLCCSAASFCENDGKTDGYAWCGCGCQFGYGRCFLYADGTCPTPTSTTGTLSVVPYTAVGARAVITRIVEEPEVKVGRLVREEERDKSGLAWLWERIAG